MSFKYLFFLVLIVFLSSSTECRKSSSCPGKCLKISRRAKFRCRRLFQSCELKTCIRRNKKGDHELGIVCAQKESALIDSNPPDIPSRSPAFLGAVNGESLLPETSNMPNIEFSPIIPEESMELESSLEPDEYETELSSPEASSPPNAQEEYRGGPSVIHNPQVDLNPFQSATENKKFGSSSKPTDDLGALAMRTTLESNVRKQDREVFYEDSKNGEEEDDSDPDSDSDSDNSAVDVVEENDKETSLQAFPKIIRVGEPSVVKLSMKVRGKDEIDGLECLRAYRLDSMTNNRTGLSVDLADDGTAVYFDDTAQDNIFAGMLAIVSETLNERIGFEVVPVIDGIENASHPLFFKEENVISSYGNRNPSADAIGGGLLRSPRMTVLHSLKDLQLKVHFMQFWDAKLMSSAQFLQDVVGVGCEETGNSNELMHFTDEGNVQTVSIDLNGAIEKGLLQDSIVVQLRAAYKEAEDSAPILLVSVLENKRTKSEVSRTRLSLPVQVGVENECPEAVVAKISVYVGEKTAVVLKGTSMRKVKPLEYK